MRIWLIFDNGAVLHVRMKVRYSDFARVMEGQIRGRMAAAAESCASHNAAANPTAPSPAVQPPEMIKGGA